MLKGLTPLGIKTLVGIVLVAIFAVVLAIQAWNTSSRAKTETRLSNNQTEAALNSGTDAVETLGEQSGREDQTDAITKDNDNAIRKAPGADAAVNPDLDAVARERLCRRTVYRLRPECLQFTTPE